MRDGDDGKVLPGPWAGTELETAAGLRIRVPTGVELAPDVDLEAPDPALEGSRRRCIALSKLGVRCKVNAMADGLLCPAHGGRLDSAAGGRAKAARIGAEKARADAMATAARLGARAVIAQTLLARADDVARVVNEVVDEALERELETADGRVTIPGSKQARDHLLKLMDQAFGSPHVAAGESSVPSGDELATLSTDELRRIAFGDEHANTA